VERLGLSAAAVSEQVNRLVDQGYAELLDDRSLRLTARGRDLATSIVRRHRLAERLLVDVIGLEWEKVHREADRWEHAISADVEQKLVELLGDPATCPHGNPIPGSAHRVDTGPTVPLALAPAGPVLVARISEKIELDDRALRLLAAARLVPGSEASVLGSGAEGTRVRNDAGEATVPADVARLTFVVPLE
jgi:DtxR family Mn-dependent transcriptional regulator